MTIKLTWLVNTQQWSAILLTPEGHTTSVVGHGETRAEAIGFLILNYPVPTGVTTRG
jgi:hypothetical protein